MTPLSILPEQFQRDFMATLQRYVDPDATGHFYLVGIHLSGERDYQSQRITVRVVDENGFPLLDKRVAFAFSTAAPFVLTPDFLWNPPPPQRAFIQWTQGGGQIDMVLGPEGVVKAGQPGGVTVYLLEPEYSSDVITGMGMLADHRGVVLTFQLQRNGVKPLLQWVEELEVRVRAMELVEWDSRTYTGNSHTGRTYAIEPEAE